MLQDILEVFNFIYRRNLRIPRFGICGRQRILGGTDHRFIVSKLAADFLRVFVRVRAFEPTYKRVWLPHESFFIDFATTVSVIKLWMSVSVCCWGQYNDCMMRSAPTCSSQLNGELIAACLSVDANVETHSAAFNKAFWFSINRTQWGCFLCSLMRKAFTHWTSFVSTTCFVFQFVWDLSVSLLLAILYVDNCLGNLQVVIGGLHYAYFS